jgi:hypothetical protein
MHLLDFFAFLMSSILDFLPFSMSLVLDFGTELFKLLKPFLFGGLAIGILFVIWAVISICTDAVVCWKKEREVLRTARD